NFTRELFDYTPPESSADIVQLLQAIPTHYTGDKDYISRGMAASIGQMETLLYLKDTKHQELDILSVLSALKEAGNAETHLVNKRQFTLALDDFMNRNDAWPKETDKLIETYKFMEKEHLFPPRSDTRKNLLDRIMGQIEQEPVFEE